MQTVKLSDKLILTMSNLPEIGMGYQIVNVILKSGQILNRQKVLNSELLILEENENIFVNDIDRIELENFK